MSMLNSNYFLFFAEDEFFIAADMTLYSNPVNRALGGDIQLSKQPPKKHGGRPVEKSHNKVEKTVDEQNKKNTENVS